MAQDLDETTFRAALDGRGFLREGALPCPPRDDAAHAGVFLVFAQRPDARMAIDEWRRHAERFVKTRIGLTTSKQYDDEAPRVDAARVVVVPFAGPSETRTLWGRPRSDADLLAAESADGGAGLALLAGRCDQVWVIACVRPEDLVALRLAVILAGVGLGPILTPSNRLLGPKTARSELAE